MGCYPVGKIVSKALGKCNGRERWREERMNYAMAYPPGPPTEIHYMRPVARTVTFSNTNSVHVIPPSESSSPPPPPQQSPVPQPQTPPPQQQPDDLHPPPPQPEPEQPCPAQAAPPDEQPRQPKRGKKKRPGRVRFGPEPPPQQQEQEPQHAPGPGDSTNAPGYGHGQAHGHGHGPAPVPQWYSRYTPSPLPRWEATPRRHEYFSSEYRYSYPTPVREGIYRIATDANRLTTIFSEENPNACTIV